MTIENTSLESIQQATLEAQLLTADAFYRAAEETVAKAKLETEQAALILADNKREIEYRKQHRRPSQERYANVEFDSDKKLWAAISQGVVAYGETPEIACDNFDHLWLYGDTDK